MRENTAPLSPARALERLAKACAKTEYCEDDLRRKLRTWKVAPESHDEIIGSLRGEKYIDDARYCRAFVEEKWKFNRWGKTKIRMELRHKRLPAEEIEGAIGEMIGDEEYAEVLAELLRQKERTLPTVNDYERYQRLIRFAVGRGFEPSEIRECLEREIGE